MNTHPAAQENPREPQVADPSLEELPTVDGKKVRAVGGVALYRGQPFTGRAITEFQKGGRQEAEYLDGLKHGTWTVYYANGNKRSEERFTAGQKRGIQTTFFENGQRKVEIDYAGGPPSSSMTYWNEDGSVKRHLVRNAEGRLQDAPFENGGGDD